MKQDNIIKAAPEMLKTLEFVLNDENTELDYETRLMIESIIKKARGE